MVMKQLVVIEGEQRFFARTWTSTACTMITCIYHGLQPPNEGINQRNMKIWADVADKICFGRTYMAVGVDFRLYREDELLTLCL